jgi:Bacterial capsule synthesis protein PGA_cap
VFAVRASTVLGVVFLVAACVAGSNEDGADHWDPGPSGQTRPVTPVETQSLAAPTSTAVAPSAQRGPRGSGQTVTFAFAGETQFPDVIDTEAGAVSTGLPLLSDQLKADPTHVLAPVTSVLSTADVAMVNLETAITERGEPVPYKQFHFRSPATSFTALKAAGVDVVNMANNHALDYGPVGQQDTFDAIASSQFSVVGIGHDAAEAYRPYRTIVKDQRIAIFGALDHRVEPQLMPRWLATDSQPGVAMSTDGTHLVDAVRAERPEVDTLVVFMHWGTETTHCGSSEQQDLAATLIAAGADIVVGSHAHRVFGAGRIGTSFVAYGLGNFTYWREDAESGRSGVLLVQATGRQVDSYSWVPARITHGIPIPQTGAAAAADVAEWQQRRACSGLSP